MHPSFDLWGLTSLPAYFTFLMVGFTLAILWVHAEGVRRGLDGNSLLDLGLLMLVCGLVGSRVLHVFADGQLQDYINLCLDPDQVSSLAMSTGACTGDDQCLLAGLGDRCLPDGRCGQYRDCLRVFKIWYGGYAYYGGLLLAVPTGLWFLRRRRLPVWQVADLASFGISLGLVFGRFGCFLAGCCFGETTDSALGLQFPAGSPAWDRHVHAHQITALTPQSLAVHPTQLYEAAACALLCVVCFALVRRGVRFSGQAFFVFIGGYSLFRIAIEAFRDDDRGLWLGGDWSTSQLISLPLLAWTGYAFWRGQAWPWPPKPPSVTPMDPVLNATPSTQEVP